MLFSFALAVKTTQESPSILAEKSSNSVYVNMLVDMFIRPKYPLKQGWDDTRERFIFRYVYTNSLKGDTMNK